MDCSKTKIIVKVSGGVVTDVYTSPDLNYPQVVILDYDDKEDFELDQLVAEAEIDKNQVNQVY